MSGITTVQGLPHGVVARRRTAYLYRSIIIYIQDID